MKKGPVGGAQEPRGRRTCHFANRDSLGFLRVSIPALLASGAHQEGEESQLVVYLTARAFDTEGCGRVEQAAVARELRAALSGKQLTRVFESAKGTRYWELDRGFLRLKGQAAVLAAFECELLDSDAARAFSVRYLDTRQRRGAALLAAVLAGQHGPRSLAFIARFARVDPKTRGRWAKDPVITGHILRKHLNWTMV